MAVDDGYLSHDSVCREMLHLLYAPAIALPELIELIEVLVAQVILDLRGNVEASELI